MVPAGPGNGTSRLSVLFAFLAIPLLLATTITSPATSHNYLVKICGKDAGAELGMLGVCYYTVDIHLPTVTYTTCTSSHVGYAIDPSQFPSFPTSNTTATAQVDSWHTKTRGFILTPFAAAFCVIAVLLGIFSTCWASDAAEALCILFILLVCIFAWVGFGLDLSFALTIHRHLPLLTNNIYTAHIGAGIWTSALGATTLLPATAYALLVLFVADPSSLDPCQGTACCEVLCFPCLACTGGVNQTGHMGAHHWQNEDGTWAVPPGSRAEGARWGAMYGFGGGAPAPGMYPARAYASHPGMPYSQSTGAGGSQPPGDAVSESGTYLDTPSRYPPNWEYATSPQQQQQQSPQQMAWR